MEIYKDPGGSLFISSCLNELVWPNSWDFNGINIRILKHPCRLNEFLHFFYQTILSILRLLEIAWF